MIDHLMLEESTFSRPINIALLIMASAVFPVDLEPRSSKCASPVLKRVRNIPSHGLSSLVRASTSWRSGLYFPDSSRVDVLH